ncbi:MAG: DUF2797 domain-containing protein [Bacteroidota bacterium]
MSTKEDSPIQYILKLGDSSIIMNELVGTSVKLHHTGKINCRICGRKLKKTYGEGFCYDHFMKAPENSPCIIRPELCEGHMGIGRDVAWEEKYHNKPHIVYLAVSSGIKVGVTRQDQIPTRWIDQGAWKAIILAEVPYRKLAGEIEVSLKTHISDKTNWQRMLKNELAADLDLVAKKKELSSLVPEGFQSYLSENDQIWELSYPVNQYPQKVKSINLLKQADAEAVLMGIKGQYLIFDNQQVINIRKHTGFEVELSW